MYRLPPFWPTVTVLVAVHSWGPLVVGLWRDQSGLLARDQIETALRDCFPDATMRTMIHFLFSFSYKWFEYIWMVNVNFRCFLLHKRDGEGCPLHVVSTWVSTVTVSVDESMIVDASGIIWPPGPRGCRQKGKIGQQPYRAEAVRIWDIHWIFIRYSEIVQTANQTGNQIYLSAIFCI